MSIFKYYVHYQPRLPVHPAASPFLDGKVVRVRLNGFARKNGKTLAMVWELTVG